MARFEDGLCGHNALELYLVPVQDAAEVVECQRVCGGDVIAGAGQPIGRGVNFGALQRLPIGPIGHGADGHEVLSLCTNEQECEENYREEFLCHDK